MGSDVREIIGIVLKGVRPLRSLALIVLLAALGCHAQTPTQTSAQGNAQGAVPSAARSTGAPTGVSQPVQAGVKLSPEMARRIEVMIRSKSQISLDYTISFGVPTQGEIPGYDEILVTFTSNDNSTKPLPFLISTDGKTLAQFNKFDLSQDPRDKVSVEGRPARGGPPNAPVLIVGFDDLECPFCAQMNALLFPAVLNRYKDQVRVVYRDLPLVELHPWAMHAAVDANCLAAGSTAGYWEFVDYVHAHAAEMAGAEKTVAKADQTLDKIALDEGARLKLDAAPLAACVQKQDETKIKASVESAEAAPLRLNQAPVLFINGEEVDGIKPIETIYRVIDAALVAEGQTPPPPPPTTAAAAQPAQTAPPQSAPVAARLPASH